VTEQQSSSTQLGICGRKDHTTWNLWKERSEGCLTIKRKMKKQLLAAIKDDTRDPCQLPKKRVIPSVLE
jgi:hypothetical protein